MSIGEMLARGVRAQLSRVCGAWGIASAAALGQTTTAPTLLKAGIKDNVVPASARATVNFRILPGETARSHRHTPNALRLILEGEGAYTIVNGEVLANIWQTDLIARISPETGEVVGWIDLRGLLTTQEAGRADVLNGIAYDAARDRLFVTGKLWPWRFEIELTKSPRRR